MTTKNDLKSYVKKVQSIEKKKRRMMKLPDNEINEIYESLKKNGKIQCNDPVSKESKVDRIISITEFPDQDFVFRELVLDDAIIKEMENDWDYSTKSNREVFRTLCLDKKNNKIYMSSKRAEGTATSVAPDWELCDKSFPNKGYDVIGSVHSHPDFLDKPLESMGDVIVFSTSDKEMYSCTTTKWGAVCMYRMKEPISVFNIPKIKADSDPEKPEPERDSKGKIIYDVKSDVVDWNRAMKFANRDISNSIFILSRGKLNKELTERVSRVPWYKPNDEEKSVGTVEVPFPFGMKKSNPKKVRNMRCETFVDVVGVNTKIRTVCNDAPLGENFYVESNITPGRLFFFGKKGFPTNFYFGKGVQVSKEHPLDKTKSLYWDYFDKTRPGYFKTKSESSDELTGNVTERTTVRSAAFTLNGEYECEYLLYPLPEPEGGGEHAEGKPGGILCRKERKLATDKTCVLTVENNDSKSSKNDDEK